MKARLVPHVEVRCGFCNVQRKTRSREEVDLPPAAGRGFMMDERQEYTCAVCGGKLICYVGNLMVSEITGTAGWVSEPDVVDAYEYSQRAGSRMSDRG